MQLTIGGHLYPEPIAKYLGAGDLRLGRGDLSVIPIQWVVSTRGSGGWVVMIEPTNVLRECRSPFQSVPKGILECVNVIVLLLLSVV